MPNFFDTIKHVKSRNKQTAGLTYIDNGKAAAARLASTLIRSALDATATLRPLLLHCEHNYCTSIYH